MAACVRCRSPSNWHCHAEVAGFESQSLTSSSFLPVSPAGALLECACCVPVSPRPVPRAARLDRRDGRARGIRRIELRERARLRAGRGELHARQRAAALGTLERERGAVALGDRLRDRQAEAAAGDARRPPAAEEAVEGACSVGLGHPRPVVAHREPRRLAVRHADVDGRDRRAVLDRVVDEHAHELVSRPASPVTVAGSSSSSSVLAGMRDAQLVAGVGDQAVEPQQVRAEPAGARLCEREQLAQGRREPGRLLLDDARRLARLLEIAALRRPRTMRAWPCSAVTGVLSSCEASATKRCCCSAARAARASRRLKARASRPSSSPRPSATRRSSASPGIASTCSRSRSTGRRARAARRLPGERGRDEHAKSTIASVRRSVERVSRRSRLASTRSRSRPRGAARARSSSRSADGASSALSAAAEPAPAR